MDIIRRFFGKSNASTPTPPTVNTQSVTAPKEAAKEITNGGLPQNGAGSAAPSTDEVFVPLTSSANANGTAEGSPAFASAPAPATPQPAEAAAIAAAMANVDKYATRDLAPDMIPGSTRQLPPLEAFVAKPGRHITYGVHSHTGMVRTNNQDALLALFSSNLSVDDLPDFGLFVVADGMGGHHDGEKASALATRLIAHYVSEHFYLKLLNTKDSEERPIISEVLNEAIQQANRSISEQIPEGGTTCTAVTILGDLAYIAHVGDSRAYLLADGGIEQITRDHSLVQRLIELDQLTIEEAAQHPQRNVLYRALGQSESLDVDAITRRLPPGSRLLLCSDGLWNHVPESLIVQIIRTSKTPQEACDKLVSSANERGGLDNITAVVVQVPG
ncbi:MAG: Stp1/IreP family PP2C-type Ser/Thr phosphatase [Anaerolineae bacterium]|nr:Stp1/IreP family PP2C-type Ser/Thr phosphatase [Anaerolineae bacterium]